ncbi:acylglycerone-phosphate reductase [Cryptococcus neoformans]|nr:acylglycerone-phosphate reductase [Cryptococcus neoformans var. grubii]OXC59797.1 acylglycerone-phosphate reductase [Cryptococcus neoformans var. grubii MW-RSA852]
MSITQRSAFITGCSSPRGIAAQVAAALASKGYLVFASAKTSESLGHLQGKCEPMVLDVTDEKNIAQVVKSVSERTGGRLDVLVDTAGIDTLCPLLDTSLPALRGVLETNTIGPLALIQGFAPLLVKAANEPVPGTNQVRQSVIVNMGSLSKAGFTWKGGYSMSKAALECMTEVLRSEMKPLGVQVINCHIGTVNTDMYFNQKIFDTKSPNPTPYYPNFSTIADNMTKDSQKAESIIMKADTAGQDIAKVIDKVHPPGFIRAGSYGALFDWAAAIFDFIGLKNWFWGRQFYTHLVPKPDPKKSV